MTKYIDSVKSIALKDKLPTCVEYWLDWDLLVPIQLFPYPSWITERIFEIDRDTDILFFRDFERIVDNITFMTSDGVYRKKMWDNKIVLHCKTRENHDIYIGFHDFSFSVGLGVRHKSYTKPYPVISF